MGRIPWSPQSYKNDTMGVGLNPNCPDRSWCVASLAIYSRKRRHRPAILLDCSLAATLRQEEKGKTLLEKETESSGYQMTPFRSVVGSTAAARDSAPHPLRSARPTSQPKRAQENHNPIDNLHRRSTPLSSGSLPKIRWRYFLPALKTPAQYPTHRPLAHPAVLNPVLFCSHTHVLFCPHTEFLF
jgi:hypothetical protein